MADETQGSSSEPASGRATPRPSGKKEVKILMLHGYTQSGPLFRAKTRALEKSLHKGLAPLGLAPKLIYPTAPNRLRPADIPGYEPPLSSVAGSRGGAAHDGDGDGDGDGAVDADEGPTSDAWAWYRKDEATGAYRLLGAGMRRLAAVLRAEGPVDGAIGFSQGGAVAAMLAAMLEPGRQPPSSSSSSSQPEGASSSAEPDDDDGSFGVLPELRAANGHRQLRFAVSYSGFFAPATALGWLYAPPLATPTLHYLGSLDTMVDEARSRGLVARCADPVVLVHPGGHYVPVSREWVAPLVGFVRKHCEGGARVEEGEGEGEGKDVVSHLS